MTSKYLQKYYTRKRLIGELLSNIICSQNFANVLLLSRGSREGGQGEENEKSTDMLCDICTRFTSYLYSTK